MAALPTEMWWALLSDNKKRGFCCIGKMTASHISWSWELGCEALEERGYVAG